jgi:hypothetical protein
VIAIYFLSLPINSTSVIVILLPIYSHYNGVNLETNIAISKRVDEFYA